MKKSAYLLAWLSIVVILAGSVSARLTGTNPTGANSDAFCVGKTSAEWCVDYLGDSIPTTANTQTSGTSALPWLSIYAAGETIGTSGIVNSGALTSGTIGATPAANTGGTAATQSSNAGLDVRPPYSAFSLVASSMVPVNASLIMVGANAATVSLTSQPEIATTTTIGGSTLIPFGTFLVISSTATGQNVVFTSSTSSNASGLILGASTRTITKNKTLWLWLDNITVPAVWREIAFGNN